MNPIAHIETPFQTKFGIPRQAGIVEIPARIVFEPEYRVAEALRGLEDFDYLWLVWVFSQSEGHEWSPTVRPPRLGGNRRIGVFATRSPFRPNPIGLSSVKIVSIEHTADLGPVINISGADLMNGTPILDIKPYLPYTDSHPDARSGFATQPADQLLEVECPQETLSAFSCELRNLLLDILAHDPRPQYQHDPERIYGMSFYNHEVKFRVDGNKAIVISIGVNND